MSTALLGGLAALLAAMLHGVVARWLSRTGQLLSIPLLGVACALLLALGAPPLGVQLGIVEQALVLAAATSLCVAYMFAFVGVVYDSPTLAIANAILDHGAAGMPETALDAFVARHPFATSRIRAMAAAGMLVEGPDGRLLPGRVGLLMRLGGAYRRLCGLRSSTG